MSASTRTTREPVRAAVAARPTATSALSALRSALATRTDSGGRRCSVRAARFAHSPRYAIAERGGAPLDLGRSSVQIRLPSVRGTRARIGGPPCSRTSVSARTSGFKSSSARAIPTPSRRPASRATATLSTGRGQDARSGGTARLTTCSVGSLAPSRVRRALT